MPLGVRLFLVYFLFVGLTGYFVLSTVMEEIRPGVRQSTEETLVDTVNLLAEILRDDLKAGTLEQSHLPGLFQAYGQRRPQADIWGVQKNQVNHRIYVTDARGTVLLDSSGADVGRDYSRWNDVYLTLQGQYGARSTREDPNDPESSVMYVAAPIKDDGKIIGVVAVSKPSRTLQPYIERSQRRLAWLGAGLILLGLLVGGLLSWWLSGSLRRLTRYAEAASAGRRVELPQLRGGELAQLAQAVQKMRTELDGKAYVERYVHTLTHELKSPLAAIRGAAELLQGEMPAAQRERFVGNIDSESRRLQQLIERLLNLAQVEQRQGLEERVEVPLRALVDELLQAQMARIECAAVQVDNQIPADMTAQGERFLLRQALANLLDNALDFSPRGGRLRFYAERRPGRLILSLFNPGEAIPDYALPRLTERFYSLPRPGTGRKSTGLGLNFVQEVAQLHGGALMLGNVEGGVQVSLELPCA
ncbi:MAG: two-component system sensor histidine kinase CreC [Pseudomonas sp.]|uniref:two-component system sensor histidine kinase CreC n=1 Tax=Pseudomonas sp. TaxID=306 RepID=UPI003390B872